MSLCNENPVVYQKGRQQDFFNEIGGKCYNINTHNNRSHSRKRNVMKTIELLIETYRREQEAGDHGGIYGKTQVDFSFHSNRIEGSQLSKEHTRQLFETRSILSEKEEVIFSDDIVCANNHFRAFQYILEHYREPLTADFIKTLHGILLRGTKAEVLGFPVGEYKTITNYVGDRETAPVKEVASRMEALLAEYEAGEADFKALVRFHYLFESIHPFQDGNGRTGRLLLFKECLRRGVIPFIIEDSKKAFYYRGLREYARNPEYLEETCGEAQDSYVVLCCQLVKDFKECAEAEGLIRPALLRVIEKML